MIARCHPKHLRNTSVLAQAIALEIQTVAALWFRCPPLPPRGETLLGSSGEDSLHECEIAPPNFLAKAVASLLFIWGRSGRWAVTTLGSIQRRSETVQGLTHTNSD